MLRFFYLVGVLGKYSIILFLFRIGLIKKPTPETAKAFFEEAGGSFVKFGQILSLRVDLLPREYTLELLNLLDQVRPFPYPDVENIIQRELGAKPEEIFEEFSKEPFASASFGQVHLAKVEGREVVVKLLRPGIEEDVGVDFVLIRILAFVGDIFFKIKAIPWRQLADEFERWTREELNYKIEAENTEKIYQTQNNPNVVIPKVYFRYSTRRILVQDFVNGISLTKVLKGLKTGELTRESLLEQGIDIKKTPRLIVEEMLRQYFFVGFYHADPHPGNILLLPENKLGLIDFGILGSAIPNQKDLVEMFKVWSRLDSKATAHQMLVFAGRDLRQIVLSALPASVDEGEVDKFIQRLGYKFAMSLVEELKKSSGELKQLKTDYLALMFKYLKYAETYRIRLPKEMGAFFRALGIIGFVSKELDKRFYITEEFRNFLIKYNEKEFKKNDLDIPIQRIDRIVAMERLANWLAYLVEKDPVLYKLASEELSNYNILKMGR